MSNSTLNPFRHAKKISLKAPPSEEILRDFTRLLSLVTGRFKPNDIEAPEPEKALIFHDLDRKPLSRIPAKRHFHTTRLNPEHSL